MTEQERPFGNTGAEDTITSAIPSKADDQPETGAAEARKDLERRGDEKSRGHAVPDEDRASGVRDAEPPG